MSEIHGRRPRRCTFEFWFMRNISHHRKNLGHVGKIETLPILPTCYRPSQTIGDIYDFGFALVSKILESPEPMKSPIVWDFPDVWKPGLKLHTYMYIYQPKSSITNLWKIKKLENIIWNWFAVEVKRCSWVNKTVFLQLHVCPWELAKAADLFIT